MTMPRPADPSESKIEILTRALISRIADGTYPPGAAIPSGSALRDEFKISQQTVRTVTVQLKAQGILETGFGRGLYVAAGARDAIRKLGG